MLHWDETTPIIDSGRIGFPLFFHFVDLRLLLAEHFLYTALECTFIISHEQPYEGALVFQQRIVTLNLVFWPRFLLQKPQAPDTTTAGPNSGLACLYERVLLPTCTDLRTINSVTGFAWLSSVRYRDLIQHSGLMVWSVSN